MKSKRIIEMEKFVSANKAATIEELSSKFNVSVNTVRRDINELVKSNKAKKVYGGIEIIEENLPSVIDYTDRKVEHYEEKKKVGHSAAQLIKENDIIYIDTGTTTSHILDYVNKDLAFTIITNSLDVINKAILFNNAELFIIGEKYKPLTRSFIGIDSNILFEKYNIQKAFMAATGVDLNNGLSNSEIEENFIKQIIINKSKYKYACVDHSKIGHSTLLSYATLTDLDAIITDQMPENDLVKYSKKNGIKIIT